MENNSSLPFDDLVACEEAAINQRLIEQSTKPLNSTSGQQPDRTKNRQAALLSLNKGDFVQCSTFSRGLAGEVILTDLAKGILVIREPKGMKNIHILRATDLQMLEKISPAPPGYLLALLPVDPIEVAQKRLERAEHKKHMLWVDDSIVSEQGKRTFVELKRIFGDVMWYGPEIKVLKCVIVREPFDENSATNLDERTSSLNTLVRVKKILNRRSSSISSRTTPPPPVPIAKTIPSTSLFNSPTEIKVLRQQSEPLPSSTIAISPIISTSSNSRLEPPPTGLSPKRDVIKSLLETMTTDEG